METKEQLISWLEGQVQFLTGEVELLRNDGNAVTDHAYAEGALESYRVVLSKVKQVFNV